MSESRKPLARLPILVLLGLAFLALAVPSSAGPRQSDPDCADYVLNGGFETGDLAGWEAAGSPAVDDLSRAGSWSAALGGEDEANEWIAQVYSLPAEPVTATLRYWIFIGTEETGEQAFDHLRVEARDEGDLLLAELGAWHNGQAGEIWQTGSVDLREYPSLLGQTIRLAFHATTDASLPTTFYLDDVSLQVCEDPEACPDPYEPNDDFDQAVGLDPETDFFAYVCDAEDHDYFNLFAGAGEEILALLDGGDGAPLPADYELVLYGPDRNFVAKSEQPGDLPEEIRFTADREGFWSLRVYGYQGASSRELPYRIWHTLDPEMEPTLTPFPMATPTPMPATATTVAPPSATVTPPFTSTPTAGPVSSVSPTPTIDDPIGASATPSPVGGGPTTTPTPRYPGCPDAYEPNNRADESLWSILDAARSSYLCAATDLDLWKVEQVAVSRTLELRLEDLPGDYLLELFRPDGSLARSADHAGSVDERIAFTADQAGDWIARVASRGDYDIAKPYAVSAGSYACAMDRLEGQLGNDDKAHASGLDTPGSGRTEAALSICPARDQDWLSVPLGAGQRFTAEITHTRGQDHVKLCLLDRDGATELACTPGQAGTERIQHDVGAGKNGTYFLRVLAADASRPVNAWYNLNLTAPRATEIPSATPLPSPTVTPVRPYPSCPDNYELNDTPAQARPIPSSGVEAYICLDRFVTGAGGQSKRVQDEDWWRVDVLPDAGNPAQALYAQLDRRDYEVEWFAPDGSSLMARGRSDSGKPPRVAAATGTRGTWYARVRQSDAEGPNEVEPYLLTVWDERCDDRYEPNDSFGEAMAVAVANGSKQTLRSYVCHESDRDHFSVELQAGQRLDLSLTGQAGDYEMTLHDPWNNPITKARSGIIHVAQVSGKHIVGLSSRSGTRFSRRSPYELTLELGRRPVLPRRNLWVMDMELTQRLQTADNDLPVLTGLPAILRIYAGARDVGRVTLQTPVRAFVMGELDGIALKPPQVSCSMLPSIGYSNGLGAFARGRLSSSLNCVLPASWLAYKGQLSLTAHVYAPGIDESSPADNRKRILIPVEQSLPVLLRSVQVRDCGDPKNCGADKGPAFADYDDVNAFAERLLPVSKIDIEPPGSRWVRAAGADNGTFLALLKKYGALSGDRNGYIDVVFGASRKLHAWIGGRGGLFAFWARVDAGGSKKLVTHELSHALGLSHVDACGAAAGSSGFTTYSGSPRLDLAGSRSAYGLDLGLSPAKVFAPQDHHDIMTYCYDWISRFHYARLHSDLKDMASRRPILAAGQGASPQQEIDPQGRYLAFFGGLDPVSEEVELLSPERMSGSELNPLAFGSDDGDYRIQLEDAAGALLAERAFEIEVGEDGQGQASFAALLPDPPDLARISIWHVGREIYARSISLSAPQIVLQALPVRLDRPFELAWSATDADGDRLQATLYLSLDDGSTWRMVLTGVEEDRASLDPSYWPAAESARLRLRVSDGLREVEATSEAFRILPKVPGLTITLPSEGASLAPGSPVLLSATAWDPEDGALDGEALVWSSDREGELGQGKHLLLPELSAGWHRIELLARDSEGQVAMDGVRVFVGQRAYAPYTVVGRR